MDPPFSVTPCPPVPDTGVPEGVRDGVREGEEEGEGMGVGDPVGEGAARGTRTLVPAGCVSRAAVAPDPGALVTTLRDTRDASRASGVPASKAWRTVATVALEVGTTRTVMEWLEAWATCSTLAFTAPAGRPSQFNTARATTARASSPTTPLVDTGRSCRTPVNPSVTTNSSTAGATPLKSTTTGTPADTATVTTVGELAPSLRSSVPAPVPRKRRTPVPGST